MMSIILPSEDCDLIYIERWGDKAVYHWLGACPDESYPEQYQLVINLYGCFPSRVAKDGLPKGLICFTMPFYDVEKPDLLPTRSQLTALLMSVRSTTCELLNQDNHIDVLWHCQAGINRSAFVLALYLMEMHQFHHSAAIELIHARRSDLCLGNRLFVETLKGWNNAD